MVSLEKSIIIDSFPIYWNAQYKQWVMLACKVAIILDKCLTQCKANHYSQNCFNDDSFSDTLNTALLNYSVNMQRVSGQWYINQTSLLV